MLKLNDWRNMASEKELEEEVRSLRLTCDELHQKNKQLMRVNAELWKSSETTRCDKTIDMLIDLGE